MRRFNAAPGRKRILRRLEGAIERTEHKDRNHGGDLHCAYTSSKPWLSNLSVRQFSVTVRTTFSGAPEAATAIVIAIRPLQ